MKLKYFISTLFLSEYFFYPGRNTTDGSQSG